jgi:predicted DNA-binding protein
MKGSHMPKEKKMSSQRTILSMPPELKERIRKFRFANEIDTEAEAIRLLIERGLETSGERGGKGKSQK